MIQRGTAYNLLPGIGSKKKVRVRATTDHPDSSYKIPIWVGSRGDNYGQVGLPVLGWMVVADDPEFEKKYQIKHKTPE